MSGIDIGLLPELLENAGVLFVVRCMVVSAATLICWDTVLTLPLEVFHIWQSPSHFLRVAYATNKYGYLFAILMHFLYLWLPSDANLAPSNARCSGLFISLNVSVMVADTIGNVLMVFRVFLVWERNRRVLMHVLIAAVPVLISNMVLVSLYVKDLHNKIIWIPGATCLLQDVNHVLLTVIWGIQLAFDLYGMILIIFNVFDIPRRPDQSMLSKLQEDGIHILVITLCLRILCVFLSTLKTSFPLFYSVVFLILPVITASNARLMLRLSKMHPMRSSQRSDLIELRTAAGQSYFTMRSPTEAATPPYFKVVETEIVSALPP